MHHRFLIPAVLLALAVGGVSVSLVGERGSAEAATNVVPAEVSVSAEPVDSCLSAAGYAAAAAENAQLLTDLSFAPFGRAERGWEVYAPVVSREIDSDCAVGEPGFAKALSDWQAAKGLEADGVMGPGTFAVMKDDWQNARTYVGLRAGGVCPNPPAAHELVRLEAHEGYKGKAIELRTEVAAAYRAMVAAAKAEDPRIGEDLEMMQIYSGYRSPSYDDARCARDGNCGGITRAKCSSHRTGYTFDMVVGHAPGHSVDSTNDENRLHMTRTPAYQWMVSNADRFGFVNYVFEPWHWEYQGSLNRDGVIVAAAENG